MCRIVFIKKPRVNNQITAKEIRVIGPKGENLGVLPLVEAISKAQDLGLDLIEISPAVIPPITKIMDFGKYLYQKQKKENEAAKKSHEMEIKGIQVGIGTSVHDLEIRARKIEKFLEDGDRVRIEMRLKGREKYLDKNFLNERLNRVLDLVGKKYRVAEAPKKSPRGLATTIEKN